MKRDIPEILNTSTEGWIPPEDMEETLLAHKKLFAGALEAILTNENPDDDEPIKNEHDLREIWPFDLESVW